MTDITVLALLVSKAKASVFTLEYISQFEPADIDSDYVDLRFEVDGRDTGTNVSIVDECGQAAKVIGALVEALEKARQRIDELEKWRDEYQGKLNAEHVRVGRQYIEKLEAQEKLIAELAFICASAGQVQREFADELVCASDNESILQAIDDLKQLAGCQRHGLTVQGIRDARRPIRHSIRT